jgi:hypothetical protein
MRSLLRHAAFDQVGKLAHVLRGFHLADAKMHRERFLDRARSEMWISESHSGTSLADSSGVSVGGSMKTSSNTV